MSSHTLDKLVYMANQIAREFAGQRPREAAAATWDHLWHFWDPRMRALILAHLEAGGEGLSDIARDAVARLAAPVEPAPRTKATEFNQAGEGGSGAGADAG
ncbi:MAG: formate dehydrogenase subunit delta [Sphingomonadales bacterium]|jgi:formate dehydrogenase subunit delta|nr:formate dehydrogenase subunit delta [Sphingomonadales bacterium]MEA3044519.1 formate dehydrogenase subunit delta [Sphingomonadales bacterium]MEA3047989.1 formate dehydrogenase subunit delta [Sphingomonadales bacterium]